jgi:predicted nucleic acid-binding protein
VRTCLGCGDYDGASRANAAQKEGQVTQYVIGADVALMLAERRAQIPGHHRLLAPTLLRSQVLAQLYSQVQHGLLAKKEAASRLDYLRGLQIRLLGDRVLQQVAWKLAERLGWADTFVAEYLALTELQGEALIVLDPELMKVASTVVAVAPVEQLFS